MKKILSFAVAAVLLMASCVKESVSLNGNGGEEVKVTFTTELPISVEISRTIGDGTAANNVYYAVYEGEEFVLSGMQPTTSERYARIELNLFKNVEYDVAFWAQSANAPYVFDAKAKKVTYNENATLTANSEALDAFYKKTRVKIDGPFTTSVKLERPLAQINFGTTQEDFDAAKILFGAVIDKSSLVVEGAKAGFDIFNGVVLNETADIELQAGSLVDETMTVNNKDFKRLATTYVFADAAGDVVDGLTLTVHSGTKSYSMNEIPAVNVKANHRTNIVGRLLTGNTNFDVNIEEGIVDGKFNIEAVVSNATGLKEAVEDANVTYIKFDSDINLSDLVSMLSTRANEAVSGLTIAADRKPLTLDLGGNTLSWSSDVQGGQMILNNGDLTIKNGNVVYTYTGEADGAYSKGNYTINNLGKLTLDDAKVSVIPEKGVNGQKFTHALYVVQTSKNLVINGESEVVNYHNIAIRQWVGSETESSDITINGGVVRGLRAIWMQLPSSSTTLAPKANLTVNDGKIIGTAIDGTQDSGNVLAVYCYNYGNILDNVQINVNGGEFSGDIALTGGANKAQVEKVTITGGTFDGPEGGIISYAADALAAEAITIKGGAFSGLKALSYLGSEGEVLNLADDVECDEVIFLDKNVKLNGNGHTLTTSANRAFRITAGDIDVEMNDLNIYSIHEWVYPGDSRGISIDSYLDDINLTLNDCSVKFLEPYGKDWAYAVNQVGNNKNNIITINGGIYEGANVINLRGIENKITIDRATLNCLYPHHNVYYGACVALWSESGKHKDNVITIKNTTFNGDNAMVLNILESQNTIVTENNTDNTLIDLVYGTKTGVGSLKEAVKVSENVISLLGNVALKEPISVSNANFEIDGEGFAIKMAEECTNPIALFDVTGGNVTFKNIVFDGIKGGAVVRTVGAEFEADNVTVKNCEHTVSQGLFRLLGKNTIKNSTFENNTCAMGISFNFDGNGDVVEPQVVENCVFENNVCNTTAVVYYAEGGSATINGNEFLNNTLNVSNGATLYLGFKKNCTVTNNVFDGNTVTATSKRSSGGLMVGNEAVVTGNCFVNNTVTVNGQTGYGNDVCASPYYAAIDLSGNYWGGGAPVEGDDYYKEYNNYEVIINDYLTTWNK